MNDLNTLLGLWQENYLSEKALITWAERAIREVQEPDYHLIELALNGPRHCLDNSNPEFPHPMQLSFAQHLAIRVNTLNLGSNQELVVFLKWFIGAGLGDVDISQPEVILAYQLDHYLSDCDDLPLALHTLKENLPHLIENSKPVFAKLAALIPEEQLLPLT